MTLSGARKHTVSVEYATADGTATAGNDYVAASGTLTLAPGDTAKTIAVDVVGDIENEQNETFTVQLSNPLQRHDRSRHGDRNAHRRRAGARVADAGHTCPAERVVDRVFAPSGARLRARRHVRVEDESASGHRGSTIPIVNAVLAGAGSTSYTHRECQAFIADTNLGGWEWFVRAMDNQGTAVAWAQGTFAFAPCRLSDGTSCHAP